AGAPARRSLWPPRRWSGWRSGPGVRRRSARRILSQQAGSGRRGEPGVELLVRESAHAGDLGAVDDREALVVQEDPGRVGPDLLGGLAILVLALLLVDLGPGLHHQVGDGGVAVVRGLQSLGRD